jgi:surfactin synthase thioesterase subunit
MIMAPSVWFFHGTLKSAAKIRLFCFPYAGRASVFCSWPKHLLDVADVCPVNLPGRGIRLHEKPFKQLAPLVRELGSAIAPRLGVPFAFFGHSLCAPLAFELAHELQTERFSLHLFPGNHFFLHTQTMTLLALIARYLEPLARRAALWESGHPVFDTYELIPSRFHNSNGYSP